MQMLKVISNGEQGGVKDGFKLTGDDFKNGKLALFDCNVNGKKVYVIPVYGMDFGDQSMVILL